MDAERAVRSRRRYRSPLREQQAAKTRAAVVAAAATLFPARGWSATGMRDVAVAAGVSLETVYAHFRSKSDLLMAAIDVGVVGDAEPVSLRDRPEFQALGGGTRRQRVQAAAHLVAGINQRTARAHLALREGAAADPDLAERLRAGEARRRLDVGRAAALVTGAPVDAVACDGLWAVIGVDVYHLLTDLRGWPLSQYEGWLADVIDRLLPEPVRGPEGATRREPR